MTANVSRDPAPATLLTEVLALVRRLRTRVEEVERTTKEIALDLDQLESQVERQAHAWNPRSQASKDRIEELQNRFDDPYDALSFDNSSRRFQLPTRTATDTTGIVADANSGFIDDELLGEDSEFEMPETKQLRYPDEFPDVPPQAPQLVVPNDSSCSAGWNAKQSAGRNIVDDDKQLVDTKVQEELSTRISPIPDAPSTIHHHQEGSTSLDSVREAKIRADIMDIVRSNARKSVGAETPTSQAEVVLFDLPEPKQGDERGKGKGKGEHLDRKSVIETKKSSNAPKNVNVIGHSASFSSISSRQQRSNQSLFSRLCTSVAKFPAVHPGRPVDEKWDPIANKEWIQSSEGGLIGYLKKALPFVRPRNSIFFFPTRTYRSATIAPNYIVFGVKAQFMPEPVATTTTNRISTASGPGPHASSSPSSPSSSSASSILLSSWAPPMSSSPSLSGAVSRVCGQTITKAEFESIYGEARELFVVDGAYIKYAGLYRLQSLTHIAPNGLGLFQPWDRLAVDALAANTLPEVSSKNDRRHSVMTWTASPSPGPSPSPNRSRFPSKRELKLMYADGQLKVEVAALQMVSFNNELYNVLKEAYRERMLRDNSSTRMEPSSSSTSTRKVDADDGVVDLGLEKGEGNSATVGGIRKKRKSDCLSSTSAYPDSSKVETKGGGMDMDYSELASSSKRRKRHSAGPPVPITPGITLRPSSVVDNRVSNSANTIKIHKPESVAQKNRTTTSVRDSSGTKSSEQIPPKVKSKRGSTPPIPSPSLLVTKPATTSTESKSSGSKTNKNKIPSSSTTKEYKSVELIFDSDSDSEPECLIVQPKRGKRSKF
ncbi:hypothetical protein K435DRAFT_790821 [Dendrothele bispora CBS 962.96]|uniref:Uncharacterized protein n=1 Tax=Dendrothele bispora (strain CBS 962.96) TaxID=1314807 RepID=A0A4S8MQL6_DENBC|nr:hypothetical protein K435DRAFT_790821 [Dendrothele bispora CBS 962.96]